MKHLKNFKELCDRKKEIFDKDIIALVDNKVSQKDDFIKLVVIRSELWKYKKP